MKRTSRRIADKKLARTAPTERDLQQLIQFATLSLGELSPGKRLDWELWALDFAFGGQQGTLLTTDRGDGSELFAADDLLYAQSSVGSGVRCLRRGEAWHVPATAQMTRWLVPSDDGLTTSYAGDQRDVFLGRAADTLTAFWHLIRSCPRADCGRLFVLSGRRLYCSSTCSQKAQWAKFLAKHPKRRRDYVREYRDRVWRTTGQRKIRRSPKPATAVANPLQKEKARRRPPG